ncbi:MAG TPA: DUF4388 domain-containing protein [Candidatus Saccharimonadales bacterium]|nr:DUF4388 domain-containing protein [Candidatus Saccharimonadales bacterium]
MALEGTLRDFSLADIFQLIGIQRKTGVLTLKSSEDIVTVSFVDGAVVSADSQTKKLEDLLGTVLVKSGDISEEQLQEALKLQRRTLQRLGHILIRQNYIGHASLREALKLQVTQVVYRLFRWNDGDYSFKQESSIEYDQEHFTPLSAESILMEGIRMIDEWPIIEKKIRSTRMIFSKTRPGARIDIKHEDDQGGDDELTNAFGGEDADKPAPAERPRSDAIVMSEPEAKVYQSLDGKNNVQDLIDQAGLGDFETCRILYDLLTRGIIREVAAEPYQRTDVAPARPLISSAIWGILTFLVFAAALISAGTMYLNPLNRLPPSHMDAQLDQILTEITRSHVQRLDEGIQIYYLQQGQYPAHLSELEQRGIVPATALRDAWGRELGYQRSGNGYRIIVYGPGGEERQGFGLEHGAAGTGSSQAAF